MFGAPPSPAGKRAQAAAFSATAAAADGESSGGAGGQRQRLRSQDLSSRHRAWSRRRVRQPRRSLFLALRSERVKIFDIRRD